jgi:hypothetical protein
MRWRTDILTLPRQIGARSPVKLKTKPANLGGTLQLRYEVGFVTKPEFDQLIASGKYVHHSQSSYYSSSGGSRVVIFPDRRVYVSSEAFGTESHIGDFVDGRFKFNTAPTNELLASTHAEFSTTMINKEIVGDENYPIPLSVSFRKTVLI